MTILRKYNPELLIKLKQSFIDRGLIYGDLNEFGSLLTPTTTIISESDREKLIGDLEILWAFYRKFNELYRQSRSGEQPAWIAELVEYGLNGGERAVTQMVSDSGLEPQVCRIDYVSITEDRKIAEVQWKSGGPGLFFGIQDTMEDMIPKDGNFECLGNLTKNYAGVLEKYCTNASRAAVNDVRGGWIRGEHYLKRAYEEKGITYLPVNRAHIAELVSEERGHFFLKSDNGDNKKHEIAFFYGYGWDQFTDSNLISLAHASLDGRIWIESPLNYLYREKFGMAIPFMPEFRGMFEERLRDILIPSVLLNSPGFNMGFIADYFKPEFRDKIRGVRKLEDFIELGDSLREQFVFKSGSGVGNFYDRGRGVFRINGSKKNVRDILELVSKQIQDGEPWIVQEYIDKKSPIEIRHPDLLTEPDSINAHARYLIYAGREDSGRLILLGGLGNYGKHWKVSGKSPCRDKSGQLYGTAFNDIWVTKE